MERDSFLYKARRKIQIVAYKYLDEESLSRFYFWIVLKKKLNLNDPKTFNEKLQWLKLYYFPYNQRVIKCADKYTVRQYVEEKGLKCLLVPLHGIWKNAIDINWENLPDKYILKCNHGCAYNIVCDDNLTFDRRYAIKQLNNWINEDFGAFNLELHYSKIEKHVITCEEYLGDEITDFKFFCFNGKPEFVYVSNDLIHDRKAQIGFFYLDGSKMPVKRAEYKEITDIKFPAFFDEMLHAAKILCEEFPFVRVDFFIANGRYYFAELTFTPSACMMVLEPAKYDIEWGEKINIDSLITHDKPE